MTLRGFLKEVGGHMRMRFVHAGYDADNMSTPPNKVVFDSDDLGTLSLIQTNNASPAVFSGVTSTGDNPYQLATWDLDFVPLCSFQFMQSSNTGFWAPKLVISSLTPLSRDQMKITVSRTGISLRLGWGSPYCAIRYQAYRLAAA